MTSAKNVLPLVALKCKRCGQPISPTEARQLGRYLGSDYSGRYCVQCRVLFSHDLVELEEHINAEDQGQRCDECHDSLDTIAARQNGKRQMYLNIKDNTLQFLCFRCNDQYAIKANNLYRDTLWGWRNKLK